MLRGTRIGALLAALAVAADAAAQAPTVDLGKVTLEELMNLRVTVAGRRDQIVADAPAAVYVLTREDIRRSGATTIPEVLRLVPGVQVARINASKWAVSVRGFNGLFSNKLLVLVDGRSVYSHLFSGALWDGEDLVLDDVARIEVIRGPGAVNWGANAVNGVINIVTRSAADTQGTFVRAATGTFEPGVLVLRHGATAGRTAYRLYGRWSGQGATSLTDGSAAGDQWQRATVGMRLDRAAGGHAFTLTANATHGSADALWLTGAPGSNRVSTMNRGAIVARWTVDRASGAQLQMQTSLDGDLRDEPVGLYRRQMAEVDVQYHVRIAARHDVVLGGSVRVDHERFDGRDGPFALTPPSATDRLGSTFVQDEITVTPRLVVTGGARIEHDHFAGWGLQPTARVMFTPGARHHVWAATSRALRTPSLQDLNLRATLPGPDGLPLPASTELSGDPALSPETLSDVEAGYRVAVGRAATVSATAFVAHYTKLRTQEPGEPTLSFGAAGPYLVIPVSFDDLAAARTRGVEFNAEWRPAPVLRVDGSLTTFALTPSVAPESRDAAAAVFDGDTPARQANLHVAGDLPRGILADARVFYVGALRNAAVPAYTRLDARFEVPLTRALSLAVIGQNLSSPGHAEFDGISAQVQATRVPRSGRLMLSWRF